MALDLSSYKSVKTNMFVRLDIPDYDVLRFSDAIVPMTVAGEYYNELGSLLGISTTASELRASASEVTVTISGVPTGNVSEFLANTPKGAGIEIRRVFMDVTTHQPLAVSGNPALKFRGLVNNFSLNEDWDSQSKTSSYTITLVCTSEVTVLEKKSAGRRTNSYDQKALYPTDVSMDRIATISNSNFQFGAPSSLTRAG